MSVKALVQSLRPNLIYIYALLIACLLVIVYQYPKIALDTSIFVISGILHVTSDSHTWNCFSGLVSRKWSK